MNRSAKVFWALVAAQVLFLLSWAGYHEWVRQSAQVLVLKCRPVDPRDILRGDFMTLRYDISDVDVEGAKSGGLANRDAGKEVWLLLEKRDRYHVVVQASYRALEPKPGRVLARGQVSAGWGGLPGRTRIDYGIERYFVPEGKGTPTFKLMEVEAAVSPAHRLYIKRVLLDGRAYP